MGTSRTLHPRRFGLAPTTGPGRWSVALLGAFVAIAVLRVMVDSLEGGQDSAWLNGMGLAAFLCAAGAMAAGGIATLRKGERSILVIASVALGTLVVVFELVEFMIPD
ncbi:MAG: hypothetical protein ACKV2O_17700 [Acidimicrobiales bacterium]